MGVKKSRNPVPSLTIPATVKPGPDRQVIFSITNYDDDNSQFMCNDLTTDRAGWFIAHGLINVLACADHLPDLDDTTTLLDQVVDLFDIGDAAMERLHARVRSVYDGDDNACTVERRTIQ